MTEHLTRLSKRLSYVLRHRPDAAGISLDDHGWVDIDALTAALNATGESVTRSEIERVVATSDKQRFEVVDGRIRAAQGHSVSVDLGHTPTRPPDVLYHGTVERFLAAILADGLRPMQRTHVHLSADRETATNVGERRGEAVIVQVDAAGMAAEGHEFFKAANGVWLTERVPPRFLTRP